MISGIEKAPGKWVFTVRTRIASDNVRLGDSIAIDGVCLTATRLGADLFSADASLETLNVTTLREKKVGARVNIERAMAADGRFGGHIVMGHVDGVGVIRDVRREGDSTRYVVEIPKEISRLIVRKGSVTIDGISLTVNDQSDNTFAVNIIPFTATNTTLAEKRIGDRVNIETDIIGKYVETFLSRNEKKGIDMEFLYQYGYMKGE